MTIRKYGLFLAAMIIAASFGIPGCRQNNGNLASIAVSPANQSMAIGTTQTFVATATFSNGDVFFWSRVVTWSSSNTDVADVNNTTGFNGVVTSRATGTAVITALDAANNIAATATVTVTDPISLAISPKNPGIAFGTAAQLSAIGIFPDGTTQNIASASSSTWTSSELAVAVANKGLISTATTTGTATLNLIYTTLAGITLSDSTLLTVTQTALASISVTPSAPSMAVGTTRQLAATGKYADGTLRDMTKSVVWTSSSNDIAIVNSDGLVSAGATTAGTTVISVLDPMTNIGGSSTVTVTAD